MSSNRVDLLINGSATGNAVIWPGGRGLFTVAGTFGGATVSLQYLGPDGTTWLTAGTYTTLTANGGGIFDLPEGQLRANVAGGTPSALYALCCSIDL
jgi:hypothetical protein